VYNVEWGNWCISEQQRFEGNYAAFVTVINNCLAEERLLVESCTAQVSFSQLVVIPVADRCHAIGMAGCGHSKIARVRAYYLYCMCLAVLTSV